MLSSKLDSEVFSVWVRPDFAATIVGFLRLGHVPEVPAWAPADVRQQPLLTMTTTFGYVGMLQADYEVIQGLHLIGTGEILDRGKFPRDAPAVGTGKPQFGGWLSAGWFFFTHFDARVDVVVRQNSPVTIQAQMHYYF